MASKPALLLPLPSFLNEARDDKRLLRLKRQLGRQELLIIDEHGLTPHTTRAPIGALVVSTTIGWFSRQHDGQL
jgi:hypothetical protein